MSKKIQKEIVEIKNAKFSNKENTLVDIAIKHKKYGWIPYTFKKDEKDESFDIEIRKYLKNATIKAYKKVLPTLKQLKEIEDIQIEEQIRVMTIKTTSGKTFHADYQARINMMSGVMSAEFAKKTETTWKLYDKDENGKNIETMVTLDELKEATYLALEKFGTLKSIGV